MRLHIKGLVPLSVIAAMSVLGLTFSAASASSGTFESARVPGVDANIDCTAGTAYIQVGNPDMAGTTVEVTIDEARQPDIHVDHGGELRQWYSLVPNEPHRLTITYDFVPGGTPDEEDQVMTVSCLDGITVNPRTGSSFTSLTPARMWDSRFGPGPMGRLGDAQTRDLTVTAVGGVPSTGVTAVVLNVTAVNPSAATHITVWPAGETMPLASNLNVPPGDVRPNLVIVKVGANGKVSFNNSAGHVDLIADIAGYYGAAGSSYSSVSPARVWDSRFGPGPTGRIGDGQTRELIVTGRGGVPDAGVAAVVLNVTAVNPSAATHVTVWPSGETKPLASNLNVPPGDVRPNLVIVKVGADGKVSFNNSAGHIDLIADIAGYYAAAGSSYTSVSPARLWDSRFGPGPTSRIGDGQTHDLTATAVAGVPSTGVTAVVLNVTAVNPSAATHVTVWPAGETMPLASNLNVPPGDVRPNLVIVKVGADGKVSFNNSAGHVDLIADIAGYYG